MLMPDREPDAIEKGIRFGCGVMAAVPIALYGTWDMIGSFTLGWIAGISGFALLIGFLAMVFGDCFWYACLRLFNPW